MFVQNKNNKGLTLIELLVVMAILGILASFTSAVMINRQKQARDAQRKSDLQQVARAMQAARNDCRAAAYYPFGWIIDLTSAKIAFADVTTDLKNAKYLGKTISDPVNNTTYFYEYRPIDTSNPDFLGLSYVCSSWTGNPLNGYTSASGSSTFVFRAKLEITSDPDADKSYNSCQSNISSSMAFSPAAAPNLGYYYVCSH